MEKLERCGMCGRYFRGVRLLQIPDLTPITEEEFNLAPLGYCPNAQIEWGEQNYESEMG